MIKSTELIIIADYSQDTLLTIEELAEICGITPEQISELISYAILHPQGKAQMEWRFDSMQIKRAQKAVRLQRDLEVNVAGIALVLDLMDELDMLRNRLRMMDKHYL